MSVVKDEDLEREELMLEAEASAKGCHLCGESVKPPFIFWSCTGGNLAFHPNCLSEWLEPLERDLVEVYRGRDFAQGWYAARKRMPWLEFRR